MGTVFGLSVERAQKKPRRQEEASTQVRLMAALQWLLPNGAFAFAVPNGGSRHPIEAANLKRQGVRAGVPDIIIVYLGKALGLELKSSIGKLSPSQVSTFENLRNAGMRIEVARSYGEAIELIREMGVPLRDKQESPHAIKEIFREAGRRRG